jgi:hypothetical protein
MSGGARWTLGAFAVFFALISAYSEATAPSKAPLVMYLFILFCVAIAVACFSGRWRTPALRVVGGITFLATVAYLVYEVLAEPFKPYSGRSEPHWINAIFALLFFGLPGLGLAIQRRRKTDQDREFQPGFHSPGVLDATSSSPPSDEKSRL